MSLPTGAGKTRVAVEAAVKYVLAADVGDKYVLWVAQTDRAVRTGGPELPPGLEQLRQGLDRAQDRALVGRKPRPDAVGG